MNWCRVNAKQCKLEFCPFVYWGKSGGYYNYGEPDKEARFEEIAKDCPGRYSPPDNLAGNVKPDQPV